MARAVPIALIVVLAAAGCNGNKAAEGPTGENAHKAPSKPPLAKLAFKDTKIGTGAVAAKGDTLFMLYTGKLGDGTVFDSTDSRQGQPISFRLGNGEMIKGWDEGLAGMKVGGKRTLNVPWSLGYGEQGRPPKIGSKADLYFDVELLDVLKTKDEQAIDRKIISKGSGRTIGKGDTVTVDYVGTLVGGKEFDKRADFKFKMGGSEVWPFFEAAVEGLHAGTKIKLRVPPAYGGRISGSEEIPPNSILNYEITVKGVG